MRLNDGKPWFRKWGVIGRLPIASEGSLLLLLGVALFLGLAIIWVQLPANSPWEEICGWTAFLVALATNAIMFWKTEDSF